MKTAKLFNRAIGAYKTTQGRMSTQARELIADAIEFAVSGNGDATRLSAVFAATAESRQPAILRYINAALNCAAGELDLPMVNRKTTKTGETMLALSGDGRELVKDWTEESQTAFDVFLLAQPNPFELPADQKTPVQFDATKYAARVAAKLLAEGGDDGAFIAALRDSLRDLRAKDAKASPASKAA